MNLCGSSGGSGAAHEVKPDRCLLAGIDFMGAMVVDLGVEICKHKKKMREGEDQSTKISWGKNEQPVGYLKTKNLLPLCHCVGLYAVVKHGYATA